MDFSKYLQQIFTSSNKLILTIPFIFDNKLWHGFFKHKLVLILSGLSAMVISFSILKYMNGALSFNGGNVASQKLGAADISNHLSFANLFDGGNKYLILILIQMLVVHFSNKTIEILSGSTIDMSVREMFGSQIRNIVVVIRNWIFELIVGVFISIIVGIFGPDWLVTTLKFIVGSYFIGFLFIDNYNYTFAIPVKDSSLIVRRHLGAAVVIGGVAKILFLLPVVGSILVSFICSVGATWYMHTSEDAQKAEMAFV